MKLQNVGRFKALSAKGDVEFRRLTLIYGLNGHGKTTLTGVIRSLSRGDATYVDERATLGVAEKPYCEVLLDTGLAKFTNGAWSLSADGIEIFDTAFVNDNVFTGEHVSAEHRKNLYDVVVGETAVALVREIDQLDVDGRQAARSIGEAEASLTALVQTPFALKDFLELTPIAHLTEKLRDCTSRLNAVRKQREVVARPQLQSLAVPALPGTVQAILKRSVEQISAEAESRVRAHIQKLDHRGEGWVRQGLGYVRDRDTCPFCGQDTQSVDLIKLYGEFFSSAYREHLVEIERATNLMEQTLGDEALQALHRRVASNDAAIQGWRDLADLNSAAYQMDQMESSWKRLRQLLGERLRQKLGNPGEAIHDDPALTAALQDFEAAAAEIPEQNKKIAEANRQIGDLKQEAAGTKAETLEGELRRLRNIEIRSSPATDLLVQALHSARQTKKDLDDRKTQKKEQLKAVSSGVLEKYQQSINRLLANFGANFTIVNARPDFSGGKATSTYQLQLNGVALDIGGAKTPRGTPCFRTALSTGDKSTLALAFFLARLEHEDISSRCIVIDDPLSSFDSFRVACTQQEIADLATRAAQTVVLSHDAFFLKGILDTSERGKCKTLHVVREAGSHVLREWNASDYFLKEAHKEFFLMRSFLEDGPPEDGGLTSIARAIRPFVEGHLRFRFPGEFGENEWLGDFIGKMRDASVGPLAAFRTKLDELEKINDYSKKFHHMSSTPQPRPTDGELRPWVQRTLAFVQTS